MAYLPHVYPVGAIFFITFRLADSLPQHIVKSLKEEFDGKKKSIDALLISQEEKRQRVIEIRRKVFGKFDHQLDSEPYGACHMNDPKVAQIIWDKIFQHEGQYYTVQSISIMPNHVHMLLDTSVQVDIKSSVNEIPEGYVQVSKWMQLIKGSSSFLINNYLGRSGTLWEKESYDHYVRLENEGEHERINTYILNNPVKARLKDRFLEAPYRYWQ